MNRTGTAIGVMLIVAGMFLLAVATLLWEPPKVIVMFADRVHVASVRIRDDLCYVKPVPAADWTLLQASGKIEYAETPGVWTLYTGGGKLDPARTAAWFKENCAGPEVQG